ncbi:sulfatase-like hydrolase/transferase [Rhodopirellula sp. SWK7]|uniref:sulfatase-like hydrolase/transferase n=1 Tax=Rhodopirellula sp. SWK7 TaxID=595460 RepID=UPI0002BE18F6|nr:sulfatase-like hydrolase/transferase [Rhodopirellula sp. SWK7]EMI45096.1 N-acetylgalactosamine 6-sulfate sulfatase (GALNS) [Rhodopirellula sp. SWK7]
MPRFYPSQFACLLIAVLNFHLVGLNNDGYAASPDPKPAPNVIFILCDDLGWGDLGILHQNESTHSKKFATPALDAMAREGAQLRNHYCPAPVCAPSRASLLLGVHQGHCGVRDNQFDKALPDNHTLATVLKTAGYRTAIIGKYGLQGGVKGDTSSGLSQRWSAYPTKRGFDDFFGYVRHVDGHLHYPAEDWPLGNSENHRTPKEFWHNEQEISQQLGRCYTTDLFTAYAKKWITERSRDDNTAPFFLYLAYDTPHAALQVPTMEYPSGRGLNGGIQWVGKDGEMINTAQGTIDSFRYPEHTGKGWSDVEERFATMVKRIDDSVGDLLQTLRDLKIDENTLVVFSSDNGPHHESYLKDVNYAPTSFQSYGPFDGTKRDTWEGGIRVPTLAWWPSQIPAGTIDRTPSQFHDWMATFADVAGTSPPAVCDGVSLVRSMTGNADRSASKVYVEYSVGGSTQPYDDFEKRKRKRKRGQMQVLMHKGYKGVRVNITDPKAPFEIYDLENDPSETKNLADTSDEFVKLQQEMQDRVLRMRRPNETAKRPYDQLLVPSLPGGPMTPGIIRSVAKGSFDYVPDFDSIRNQRMTLLTITGVPNLPVTSHLGNEDRVYRYIGFLDMPADGEYRFELQSSTPSFVRVHDAILIDNDFHHDASKKWSTRIRLAEGRHRFTITMLAKQGEPMWYLTCHAKGDSSNDLTDGGWGIPKP